MLGQGAALGGYAASALRLCRLRSRGSRCPLRIRITSGVISLRLPRIAASISPHRHPPGARDQRRLHRFDRLDQAALEPDGEGQFRAVAEGDEGGERTGAVDSADPGELGPARPSLNEKGPRQLSAAARMAAAVKGVRGSCRPGR